MAWDSIGIGVLVSFFSAYLYATIFDLHPARGPVAIVAYRLALGLIRLSYLHNVSEKALCSTV